MVCSRRIYEQITICGLLSLQPANKTSDMQWRYEINFSINLVSGSRQPPPPDLPVVGSYAHIYPACIEPHHAHTWYQLQAHCMCPVEP